MLCTGERGFLGLGVILNKRVRHDIPINFPGLSRSYSTVFVIGISSFVLDNHPCPSSNYIKSEIIIIIINK